MKNVILISLVTMLLSLTSNAQSPLSCQMQESQDATVILTGIAGLVQTVNGKHTAI